MKILIVVLEGRLSKVILPVCLSARQGLGKTRTLVSSEATKVKLAVAGLEVPAAFEAVTVKFQLPAARFLTVARLNDELIVDTAKDVPEINAVRAMLEAPGVVTGPPWGAKVQL